MYVLECAGNKRGMRSLVRGKKIGIMLARLAHRVVFVRWILLLAVLAVVCHSQTATTATKVITDADKGSEVHLKAGDVLELRLKSNPSTGFMWYIQSKSTPLLKLVHQSQTEATEPGMGRPILQIFAFEPRRSGEGGLLLHYVRSWEPPATDEEQFQIHVVIE
jgi:inhibitor of cysteine peptidase